MAIPRKRDPKKAVPLVLPRPRKRSAKLPEAGLVTDSIGRTLTQENVDELVSVAIDMEFEDAKQAGQLGFQAHALTLTTLPHSRLVGPDGRELREYHKQNGRHHLAVQAGPETMPGTGISYGTIPRLCMIHLASEAKKWGHKEINLGRSMAQYLQALGISTSGGKRGGYTAMNNQVFRLFTSSLMAWEDGDDGGLQWDSFRLVEKGAIWWNPLHPEQETLWKSTITLTDRAFEEITNRAVPLDLRGLKDNTIHRSPLALDFYVWLPFRCFTLTAAGHSKASIPWWLIMRQFGAGYAQNSDGFRNFRREARKAIAVVLEYYRHLRVDVTGDDALVLFPNQKTVAEKPVE